MGGSSVLYEVIPFKQVTTCTHQLSESADKL